MAWTVRAYCRAAAAMYVWIWALAVSVRVGSCPVVRVLASSLSSTRMAWAGSCAAGAPAVGGWVVSSSLSAVVMVMRLAGPVASVAVGVGGRDSLWGHGDI